MARLFDDGASEYLLVNSAAVTATPLTMAAWVNPDDDGIGLDQVILWVGDTAGSSDYWRIDLVQGPGAARAICYDGTTFGIATSTANWSAGTYQHVCGVFADSTDHRIFLDGANKGTGVQNSTPAGIDAMAMGCRYKVVGGPNFFFSGNIAEAAIWNVALSDDEVATLAAGASPLTIHPQNLVAYWPLWRDEDVDYVGGYDMTDVNGPSIADHPPAIFGRAMPIITVPSAAVGIEALSISIDATNTDALIKGVRIIG